MAEQARRSIISLTESLINESVASDGFADDARFDALLNDSVFENGMEISGNCDISTLDITDSVSEQVRGVEDDDNAKVDEALTRAYNTANKRFERAVGNRIINNEVIKLNPVSVRNYIESYITYKRI